MGVPGSGELVVPGRFGGFWLSSALEKDKRPARGPDVSDIC